MWNLDWHSTDDGDRDGPLWYSFRLGGQRPIGTKDKRLSRLPGVRFIQLQNRPGYEATWNEDRGNEINVEPDWHWLENQLVAARKYGEAVILMDHCGEYAGTEIPRMARQYGVAAMFSGHIHESLGKEEQYWWWPEETPSFKSGGAMSGGGVTHPKIVGEADGSFLLVKFDLNAETMTVWRVGNWLNGSMRKVLDGTYPLFPIKYARDEDLPSSWMVGTGKAYGFADVPHSSGVATVKNGLAQNIQVQARCIFCKGALSWRSDWVTVPPGSSHGLDVPGAIHELDINYWDESIGAWKDLDTGNPSFGYVVAERCVNVVNYESKSFQSSNSLTRTGWNVDCDYSFDLNRAPVFTDQPTSLNVAERTASAARRWVRVVATDANGDTLTYSLDDVSAVVFDIDGSGNITVKNNATLDSEAALGFAATVTANDGEDSAEHGVSIWITDVDEPPDRPEAPTVATVSRNSVRVSWTAVDNTGKPQVWYDLEYRGRGDGRLAPGAYGDGNIGNA